LETHFRTDFSREGSNGPKSIDLPQFLQGYDQEQPAILSMSGRSDVREAGVGPGIFQLCLKIFTFRLFLIAPPYGSLRLGTMPLPGIAAAVLAAFNPRREFTS
jgi:hypothetical protein